MKDLFANISAALKGTDGASKLIALLVGGAILAAFGVVGLMANKPDPSPAFVGLSADEKNKVCKALAEDGIAFDVDAPPGPFTVYTDEADRNAARIAAYGAGALDRPVQGITTDPGISAVFLSNGEREQMTRMRAWQEVERMLEELDFVVVATIRVAPAPKSLYRREAEEPTAAITLTIPGGQVLSRAQAMSVSRIASGSLGLEETNIIISDQAGNTPYDPGSEELGSTAKGLLAFKHEYDDKTEKKINQILALIYGPDKARVTVNSTWEFEQSATRTESAAEGATISSDTNETQTPIGSGVGGPTGLGSALSDGAGDDEDANNAAPALATSKETRTVNQPTRTTTQEVRSQEVLKRQSIALFLDSSLTDTTGIDENIKEAAGFDDSRGDTFSSTTLPFFVPPAPEEAAEGEAAAEPTPPNPMVETLLRRGVEIATALVFIALLLKSLKSSKKVAPAATGATGSGGAAGEDSAEAIDPELLARVQIEELLKADPDKVGKILASWARDDQTVGAA